MSNIKLVW